MSFFNLRKNPSLKSRSAAGSRKGKRRLLARKNGFFFRLAVELLEDRTMLDAGLPPALVMGRTLSAYFVGGVQNNQETITYTVYNEQAAPLTGVLLTDTLQPGVTFQAASQLPDQASRVASAPGELAWSLGTIQGFDRASVSLTVNLASPTPLQLDTGALAFAMLDAGAVFNSTPAATLRAGNVSDPSLLASTPDANTTDPFIKEQAAKLSYDPHQIFNFLHSDIGYNSYVGSLRGARGTLWSSAGNALDVASLGVALMRASGIPAQYEAGMLSQSQGQSLILSMFPAGYQTIGYIPTGTPTADPVNDPQLLSETEAHYWFQFDPGNGMQATDPLMASATIGQTFTAATGAFTVVPDGLRQKTEVSLTAEVYSQGAAVFGLNPLQETVVLDQVFDDVDLVGRPLSIGNFVNSQGAGGVAVTAITNTYSPYIQVGDEAFPNASADRVISGQQYQEVLTNFPLSSQILTGLFLKMTLTGPNGPKQQYDRALFDRIGYAARQGLLATNVPVDPNGPQALNDFDVWTLNVIPGLGNPRPAVTLAVDIAQERATLQAATQASGPTNPALGQLFRRFEIDLARQLALNYVKLSDAVTRRSTPVANVVDYFDSPRLIIASFNVASSPTGSAATLSLDLRRDVVRVLAMPGQAAGVTVGFNIARGITESAAEAQAVELATGTSTIAHNTAEVFAAANAQNVPIVALAGQNIAVLETLGISALAKARIVAAVQDGETVLVPRTAVDVGGQQSIGWYEVNPTTGDTVGVTEDGEHSAIAELGSALTVLAALELGLGFAGVHIGAFGGLLMNDNDIVKEKNQLDKVITGNAGRLSADFTSIGVLTAGIAFSYLVSIRTGVRIIAAVRGLDPDASGFTTNLQAPQVPPGSLSTAQVAAVAAASSGSTHGQLNIAGVQVSGRQDVSWRTADENAFEVNTLQADNATVVRPNGQSLGTGVIAVSSGQLVPVAVSGNNNYAVSGTGSLSFYGPAEAPLAVSGQWDTYSATVTGSASITLTTAGLTLNGQSLPAGTYTITTASAALTGSGPSTSPNFSRSVSISATGSSLQLGPGSGPLSVGGNSLDPTNGVALDGYTGSITVGVGNNNTVAVTLSGSAATVLTVSVSSPTLATTQNGPLSFPVNINSSLTDSFTLSVHAPAGWSVNVDSGGKVTVAPVPGVQAGTYPIQVVAQSSNDPGLAASAIVMVAITPTQPGLKLSVLQDTQYTVPFNGAEIPTAFRASLQNPGPATDTFTLTFANVPSGFALLNSGTSVAVPAGQTGVLGLYLQPNSGQALPSPGIQLSFTVTASSTSNPSITQSQVVTFTVPAIDAVTVTATPAALNTTPGTPVSATLTLSNVGNVPENVSLAATLPAGLTAGSLAPMSLAVGQTATEVLTLTPDPSTPLNSTFDATVTATFGPAASPATQTVDVPLAVVVPGAVAIANAAAAAGQLGNTDLANRLGDLSTALTNLVQGGYTSTVFAGQVRANLNPVLALLGRDPFLTGFTTGLATARAEFAAADTPAAYATTVNDLATALTSLAGALSDEAAHGFTLGLSPNSQLALPGSPANFGVVLQNTGNQPTTYDLSIAGLPANVTAMLTQNGQPITRVTLQPGQSVNGGPGGIVFALSETGGTLFPAGFTVTATAEGAPDITLSAPGTLTVRSTFVAVSEVDANPPFASPGSPVDISAKLLVVLNQPLQARAFYTVTDPEGAVVFRSTPVSLSLTVQTLEDTVDLGSFATTGLNPGSYTVTVTITDASGTPLPGATRQGTVLLGTPVTASLSTSPTVLPPGNGTVTTTLQINAVGGTPKTATVTVPTNNGVAVVPNSFSVAPTTITPGTGSETLTWDLASVPGSTSTLYFTKTSFPPGIDTFDLATHAVTHLTDTANTPDSLIFDGNGNIIYDVYSNPGEVGLFDPRTKNITVLATGLYALKDLALEPGGNSVLVSNGNDGGRILRLDLKTGAVSVLTSGLPGIQGLVYDPSGNLFVVSDPNDSLLQLDPTSGAVLRTIALHSNGDPDGITYDPGTHALWVTDNSGGIIEVSNYLASPQVQEFLTTIAAVDVFDGIESDGQGNLYIAEYSGSFFTPGRINKYNIAGNTFTPLASVFVDDIAPLIGPGAPPSTPTITWRSQVTGLQPGESRAVTLGGSVAFTSPAGAGTLSLAPTAVTGRQILFLSPPSQTVTPAAPVSYTLTVSNPTNSPDTFNLSVQGVPAGWVTLPASVTVPANGSSTVSLGLTSDPFAAVGDHGFTVTAADTSGATATVNGDLILAGQPPAVDPEAHGVVVSLTPAAASAGQGTAAHYVVQLTNTGSADDTFHLAALSLPPGVTAAFSQTSVDVPPGASNFRDVTLTLAPAPGTTAATYPFQVKATAANTAVSATASANLTVAPQGVAVTLLPQTAAPGSTLTLTVTNTGTASDTFDLSLGGPAALVAQLAQAKVTLAAGASTTVAVTTQAVSFAVPGALNLIASATSEANAAVQASATSALQVPETSGLTAQLSPGIQILQVPGTSDFVVQVNNTGNTEDAYSATITAINGPVTAQLMGLDGTPAQTIPTFRLPGLAAGALLLQTDLTQFGSGAVTIQIQSLNAATRHATAIAAVSAAAPAPIPILTPTPTTTETNLIPLFVDDNGLHQTSTSAPVLASPVLLGPSGVATSVAPTFSWAAVAGAAGYDLWVDDLTASQSQVIRRFVLSGTIATFTPATPLTDGHSYQWWLRAYDSQGHASLWGSSATFTIKAVPVLLYPTGSVNNLQPVFQWSAIGGADHYDLWVDDLTTGTNQLIRNQTVSGITFTPTTPLTPGDSYQWWVRAIDSSGQAHAWSAGATFQEQPVPTPVTLGPRGTAAASPTFSWSTVALADHYDVWVDDLTTGKAQVYRNQQVAGTSIAASLTLGDRYEWWVRAVTSAGATSSWSSGDVFLAVAQPAPTPLSPVGSMLGLVPTFTWTAGSGADHVELYLSDLTTGQAAVLDPTNLPGTSTSFTPSGTLIPGHQYEWWLRSYDALNHAGPWSPGLTFTTAATPFLLAPSGRVSSLQPALSWTAIPGADHYEVWISDLRTGAVIDQSAATATFTPAAALTSGDSYEWWVRTFDNHGNASLWSVPLTFSEGPAAVPVALSPRGTGSTTPTFTWTAAAGADHYDLYVSDLTTGQVLRSQNVSGTAAALTLSLGDSYQWWVRSISNSGAAGAWSNGATFQTISLPAPALLAPFGPVTTLQPTLSWSGVTGADHYDLWVTDVTTGQVQVIRNPNVAGTSYTPAAPLVYGHTYRFWVRSVDAQGDPSDWSLSLDFTAI